MANLTKGQRELEEEVKAKIVDAKRRGVCDGEGRSIRNEYGHPVAMPYRGLRRRIATYGRSYPGEPPKVTYAGENP